MEVAGTLFRQHGFDGAGVADIMNGAGLTHGGFYGHFDSEDDLTAEVTSRVLGDEGWIKGRTGAGTLSLEDLVGRSRRIARRGSIPSMASLKRQCSERVPWC